MVDWNRSLSFRSPGLWLVLLVAGIAAGVVLAEKWPDGAQQEAIRKLVALGVMLERDDDGNATSVRIHPGTSLKGLEQLAFLPHLKTLGLPVTDATDADLVPLRQVPWLEELILSGNPAITDAGLKNLEGSGELKALYLSDLPIDGSGFASWSRLRKLEVLNLAYTKVNEANLVHLAGMTNLRVVDVSGTQVSDAGLEYIRGLKNLEVLFVMGARVTPEGAAELNKLLPGVNVKFGP